MGNESNWMQVRSGKTVHPFDPHISEIDIKDIAHSLSMQCRFNGHTKEFYSVAEHSVRVSRLYTADNVKKKLMCLLHDASEAYLLDVPTPIKDMFPDYKYYEKRMLRVIFEAFKLPNPDPMPSIIKMYDKKLLTTEKRDLLGVGASKWGVEFPEPLDDKIHPWSQETARIVFLETFNALYDEHYANWKSEREMDQAHE